jgi:hypothetical protein
MSYFEAQKIAAGSWNPDGSKIVLDRCPHKHRTRDTASRCLDNLRTDGCADGEWRAYWHNARVQEVE